MTDAKSQNQEICRSSDLSNGGKGVVFGVLNQGREQPAFVIRHNEKAYAYLNQCAHLFLELDWDTGEFFDHDGEFIVCANHGALFEPDTGLCINGPCYGMSLTNISVSENDGRISIEDDRFSLVELPDENQRM